jgi:hypothetical protein
MLNYFAFLGLVGVSAIVVIAILLIIFVFELVMFVSAIRNQLITDNTKILWLVGMLLLHPFVAIAYYFTDYQKSK